jgi:hypothetical protein
MKRGSVLKSIFSFLVMVPLMWGTTVLALELRVPSEYSSIQDAIDAAVPGDDVVVVADGTYSGNLLVQKAITIKSENGAENCVIDCANQSRGVTFVGTSASGAVLSGFTITRGNGQTNGLFSQYENWGGAILISNAGSITISDCTLWNNVVSRFGGAIASITSSPVISRCVIENNSAISGGGGLLIYNDSPEGLPPIISNCSITNNPGNNPGISRGAGVYLIHSSATFYNCLIAGNSAISNGGAFFFSNPCSPNIILCTISNNSVSGSGNGYGGGGICCFSFSSPVITNSILWGNTAATGAEIYLSSSSLQIGYSDVNRGGEENSNISLINSTIALDETNMEADPAFVSVSEGDYHLSPGSPCIDAGTEQIDLPEDVEDVDDFNYDIDWDPRVVGNAPDMGADEFVPEATVIQVEIDIKPGCAENKINLKSWGLLAVAVKTAMDFDARSIDPSTVLFAGAEPVWRVWYDVDRDRDKDMLFFFRIKKLNLDEDSTDATLSGLTSDGDPFEGTDKVTIIKPKGKAKGWGFRRR